MENNLSEEENASQKEALESIAELKKKVQSDTSNSGAEEESDEVGLFEDAVNKNAPTPRENGDISSESFGEIANELEKIGFSEKKSATLSTDDRRERRGDENVGEDAEGSVTYFDGATRKKGRRAGDRIKVANGEAKKANFFKKAVVFGALKNPEYVIAGYASIGMFVVCLVLKLIVFSNWVSTLLVPTIIGLFWFPFTVGMLALLRTSFSEIHREVIDFFTDGKFKNDDAINEGVENISDDSGDIDVEEVFGGKRKTEQDFSTNETQPQKLTEKVFSDSEENRNIKKKKKKGEVTANDFDFDSKDLAKAVSTMIDRDNS